MKYQFERSRTPIIRWSDAAAAETAATVASTHRGKSFASTVASTVATKLAKKVQIVSATSVNVVRRPTSKELVSIVLELVNELVSRLII
jgi:hypothetical protein